MKRNLRKSSRESGITLIALVITIIVLLILAGVTLATLFGNNGILKQSQEAVTQTKEANAKEQVQLAWAACETEYQADSSKGTNGEKSTYFTTEKLTKNLGVGQVTQVDYENGTLKYLAEDNTLYEFEVANGQIYSNGEAPEVVNPDSIAGPLVDKIKADNYGDFIKYSVDLNGDGNTTNDWKVFYNDGENVFIIASDYLSNDKFPNIPTIELVDENNKFHWKEEVSNNVGAKGIDESIAKKFELGWLFTGNHIQSPNLNMKCIQDLMNTTYWNKFATGVDGAIAIGAPTIEMWINSRNQKYPSESIYYNAGGEYDSDFTIYDWSETAYWGGYSGFNRDYGYQFFMKTNNWDNTDNDGKPFTDGKRYNSGISSYSGMTKDNNLYEVDILASPSSENGEAILRASYTYTNLLSGGGSVKEMYSGSYTQYETWNLKPVVCLPSTVNATKSGTTWLIEE